jgi:hypothetical protein
MHRLNVNRVEKANMGLWLQEIRILCAQSVRIDKYPILLDRLFALIAIPIVGCIRYLMEIVRMQIFQRASLESTLSHTWNGAVMNKRRI